MPQAKTSTSALDILIDGVAGAVAGGAVLAVGYPLDTLKVRMQVDAAKFPSVSSCIKQTYNSEGFLGFYKGVTSPLIGSLFVNAILFSSYNQGLRFFDVMTKRDHSNTSFSSSRYATGGAVCGAALVFIDTPVELIKSRMQIQYSESKLSSFRFASQIARDYGLKGLYKGIVPTMIRNIPGNAAYFAVYEFLKYELTKHHLMEGKDHKLSASAIIMAGAVAGVAYWSLIFPVDVVKSKIQCDHMEPGKQVYKSSLSCFRGLMNTQGLRAFYNSVFLITVLRSFPANAVSLLVYEFARQFLRQLKE